MPRVTVLDPSNTPYRIETFDWEKIKAFLEDWAARLRPPPKWDDDEYPPMRLSIQPLFSWGWDTGRHGDADWNADTRFMDPFPVPWDIDGIMAAIDKNKRDIEEAKAKGLKFLGDTGSNFQ